MNQQERLKKLFEENAIPYTDDNGKPEPCFNDEIFIRVASELLEEREKCQCGLTLNVTDGYWRSCRTES